MPKKAEPTSPPRFWLALNKTIQLMKWRVPARNMREMPISIAGPMNIRAPKPISAWLK